MRLNTWYTNLNFIYMHFKLIVKYWQISLNSNAHFYTNSFPAKCAFAKSQSHCALNNYQFRWLKAHMPYKEVRILNEWCSEKQKTNEKRAILFDRLQCCSQLYWLSSFIRIHNTIWSGEYSQCSYENSLISKPPIRLAKFYTDKLQSLGTLCKHLELYREHMRRNKPARYTRS